MTSVAGRRQATCSNEDHDEVPALFRVTFPDGDWNPCTACQDCLDIIIENLLETPTKVLIEPVSDEASRQPSP